MDGSNYSEDTAIERAIIGDENGYRYLLEKYKGFAFTIALRIVKNEEDAEEIVQDAFIKAFKNLRRFKKVGKFSTWVYRIVYTTSLTSLRGRRLKMDSLDEPENFELILPDTYANGFEKLIKKDKIEFVNRAISKLSELENIVVTLYYTNECSIIEIGKITGWNTSTIKTRLYRARQNLYRELSYLLKSEIDDIK